MKYPIYDLAIAPLLRSLKNLDAIISKAEAHLADDEHLEEATLVQARLYPNMKPFVFQIQVATDTAKSAAARLSGRDVPAWADDEETFAEVHERIGKAISFLSGFKAEDFAAAHERAIIIEVKRGPRPRTINLSGKDYVAMYILPNFYFHMATAYNILRTCGVDVGKRDFLGDI